MTDDPRFERLPKWAQAEIERLTRDLDYWMRKATAGPADSDTFIHDYEHPTPLGAGTHVRFEITPDSYIVANIEDDYLVVRTGGHKSTHLLVRPSVSNVIHVYPGDNT